MLRRLLCVAILLLSSSNTRAQTSDPAPQIVQDNPPTFLPAAAHTAQSVPVPARCWNLGLMLSFPEGLGIATHYHPLPYLALSGFVAKPSRIKVKMRLAARSLVEKDGFSIRSPSLVLPFDLSLGPHIGAGLSFFPFAQNFYLNGSLESRRLRIDSKLSSHLEIVDPQGRTLTNTVFSAEAHTLTDQQLLRTSMGYRWLLNDENRIVFDLFSGITRPLRARTRIQTHVRVLNPSASSPDEVSASNLQEAEAQQELVLNQKARDALRKFEGMDLPILGFSLGWDL